jgi:prophage antirepressor-like protein
MQNISTFKIPSEIISGGIVTEIRTIMQDNEPWFVAKDVADVLGFTSDSAMSKALYDLEEDEKADLILNQVSSNGVSQNRKVKIVSESGLYSLIMRSRKPVAKPFQKWVTKDVLPSIRKTGSYSLNKENELEKNLIALKFAQENLAVSEEDRVKMARDLFESLGLQNQYLPTYVDGEPAFSLTHLLKKFGVKMSSQKVYLLLENENIIEKKSRKSSKKRIVKDKKGNEKEENILKTFWSIKDEKFGKNSVNSHGTSRQTQILFYEKTFEELLQKLELLQIS